MGKLTKLIGSVLKETFSQFDKNLQGVVESHRERGTTLDGKALPPLDPAYLEKLHHTVEALVDEHMNRQTNALYDLEETLFLTTCVRQADVTEEEVLDFYDSHDVACEYEEAELREETRRITNDVLFALTNGASTEVSLAMSPLKAEAFIRDRLADTKLELTPIWLIDGREVAENQLANQVIAWLEEGEEY